MSRLRLIHCRREEAPLHDQRTIEAVTASDRLADTSQERHGVYARRANRDEIAARLALYPVPRERVSNVIPLRPPEPPKAA